MVSIRLAEPQDADKLYQFRQDEEVMFWSAGGIGYAITSKSDIAEMLETQSTRNGSMVYVVEVEEEQEDTGEKERLVIGTISFREMDMIARHATIGMLIGDRNYWGRGLGTEIVRQFVRLLFTRFNMNRINIDTFADNVRAIRCYEKVGFVVEGRRPQKMWTMNGLRDQVLMGLLREDWLQTEDGQRVHYLDS
ncbi:MAG TPA: GNAT family protein [Bacilli bacterium]|nr:GNAT family protein [Bacilli bacterium]